MFADMELRAHLTRIIDETEALGRAVEAGPLETRVPGCPEWDVEALALHLGGVHRWAARIVRERLTERPERRPPDRPARSEYAAWLREGATDLVAALRDVPADAQLWRWGPAPTSQAFWARRQANETSMHRWDAESARGAPAAFPVDVALDMLDEWLLLCAGRAAVPGGNGRTLHLHATDGEGEWIIRLGDPLSVESGHAKGDCAVRGAASDLHLLAMNRRSADGLEVFGDAAVLDLWREHVRF